eukprot:5709073-Pleurochrysis_carterae.AAC.1
MRLEQKSNFVNRCMKLEEQVLSTLCIGANPNSVISELSFVPLSLQTFANIADALEPCRCARAHACGEQ